MKSRTLLALLILFVTLDLGYTFLQNYQLPLEGDLPDIVLPGPGCRKVLTDPFGWAAVSRHEVYVAPNRFFAHAAMVGYFKTVPFALQKITDPISSIYAACALFCVAVHALVLYLLAAYASGTSRLGNPQLWIMMVLILPLLQGGGYNDQMGIIDHAITYTFFYAFPLALLLVLMLPFYRSAWRKEPFRVTWLQAVALVGLMVVLAFNGAIIPGTVAVLGFGIGVHWLRKQWQAAKQRPEGPNWRAVWEQIPWQGTILLGIFGLLCLYSIYVGRYEAESAETRHTITLWQRYARIPSGLYWQLRRPGLPLLAGALLLNVYLIRRFLPDDAQGRRLRRVFQLLLIFAVVFVLLLPLGGYRAYRPLIIRRDSIMPVLLAGMYFYGISTYYLLRHLPQLARRRYLGWVCVLSLFYMLSDNIWKQTDNDCERRALEQLAATPGPVVRLPNECTVMSWVKLTNPQSSNIQAQLLYYWGVTPEKRLYYQEEGKW